MSAEYHPLHSEDVQQAAGPPAVDVLQPPLDLPDQSHLLPSLDMNYYIAYNGKTGCFVTIFLTFLRSVMFVTEFYH